MAFACQSNHCIQFSACCIGIWHAKYTKKHPIPNDSGVRLQNLWNSYFQLEKKPIVKHVPFQLILNNISFPFYCRVNVRNMTSCTPITSPLWQPPLGPTTHPIYRTKSSPVSLFMSSRVCSRKGEYAINVSLIRADVVCLQSTGRYQRDWSRVMRGTLWRVYLIPWRLIDCSFVVLCPF